MPYRFKRSLTKRIYPEMLKNYPFEVDFFGLRYTGNIVNYIDRLVYYCGAHEKFMLFFLRDMTKKLDRKNTVFLDIGANVGNHALFMSQVVDKVLAYEPYGFVREQLENKIRLNNIKNIIVRPIGLGNEELTIPFYAPPDSNLGAGSFFEDCNKGNVFMGNLQVVVGDKEIAGQGIEQIDFVKMDIEGFERFALEGLKETIKKSRPLIILEFSPKTRSTFKNFEDFKSIFPEGYGFWRFGRASYDSGRYKIAQFDYNKIYKKQDVIACPVELESYL